MPTTSHLAPPAAPGQPPAPAARRVPFGPLVLLAALAVFVPGTQAAPRPLPLLQLETTLGWTPLYAQDPLPCSVRLSSPQARGLSLQWLEDNPDNTNTPATIAPIFGSNWMAGLELTLVRQETNGQETVVLSSTQWSPYQVPPPALIERLEHDLAVRNRQWWIPSTVAQLSPGDYRLTARWVGTNYLESFWLPPDGAVVAAPRTFSVRAPDTDGERAAHAERLAREAYRAGHLESARDLALQALELAPALETPERPDTYLLAGELTLRLRDLKTSVRVLQDLLAHWPGEDPGGVRALIEANFDPIKPRLRAGLDAAGTGLQLWVEGAPDQPYSIDVSTNLQTWAPWNTLLATNGVIRITDPASTSERRRFYKSQWTP